AEESVELRRVLGGELVAVPPEPVAAFRGQRGFVRLLEAFGRQLGAGPPEHGAGLSEHRPRLVVLGMADPDAEVRVDPASGVDPRDAARGRTLRDLFAGQHRHDLVTESAVERVEEELARARVVLPRILAVEG